MSILRMLSLISKELLYTILFDYRFLPVYVVLGFFIKAKHDRYFDLLGGSRHTGSTRRRRLEDMILTGMIAGFITSILSVVLGIVIDIKTFEYIFILSVIFALINIRYICISYTGGILAFISLIFGIEGIDVTSILFLIAILHFIESVLIHINAGNGSVPVFIRHEEGIAGAYLTQRFWPVPVVFLTLAAQSVGSGLTGVDTSGWWPILKYGLPASGIVIPGLECIITGLEYSDIAITKTPEKKSRENALRFLLYSVILLLIAVLSTRVFAFKVIGSLFAAAAHAGITFYGYYTEKTGIALFKPAKRGLKVFDLIPGGHAEKMGIEKGYTILGINSKDVQTEEGLKQALKEYPPFVWVDFLDLEGRRKTLEYKCYPEGINELGITIVPRETEVTYNIDYFENHIILKNIVSRYRKSEGRGY